MAAPMATWGPLGAPSDGLDVPWNGLNVPWERRGVPWDVRVAPWNRLDVPWPTSNATVALPAEHPAVSRLAALRRCCDTAGRRLSGPGLAAEGRVLHAVLYAYHSRLLRHRPYLALQQVEQCLKRLWKMNLVGCLGTVVELIPKKDTSEAHAECLVPSQPILETVALKVLGGCKLIQRLLDCCSKTFLLLCRNLRLLAGCCSGLEQFEVGILISQIIPEYRLANSLELVCSANLITCCLFLIQYRCILQTLMSLYDVLSTTLHLVSETQKMPYIKGFTFPSDIGNFLGVDRSEVKKQEAKMLKTKKSTSWLKKLFPTMPEAVSEVGKKRNFGTCKSAVTNRTMPCPVDIGKTVLVPKTSRAAMQDECSPLELPGNAEYRCEPAEGSAWQSTAASLCKDVKLSQHGNGNSPLSVGKHLGVDVKSLLKPSRHPTQEGINISSTPFKAKLAPPSSRIAKSHHTGSLVHMVQRAASFGELSEALRKAILWCKKNKFKSAAYFLRNKLLKSNRLHHVEAQGCSLKKKLRCVQTSVRKYLLYGSRHAHWPKQYLRAWLCPRRIRSSARLKGALKTVQQKPSDLSGVCETSASLILPAYQDVPPSQEERSDPDAAHVRLSIGRIPKQLLLEGSPGPVWKESSENMDIDSIFAAIGV